MKNIKNILLTSLITVIFPIAAFSADPNVEQVTGEFLAKLAASKGKPIEKLSPADARNVLLGAQESENVVMPKAEVEHKTIVADGMSINLVIVRPEDSDDDAPAFMFFHGGGWVLGDFPTHERFVRDLVVNSGAVAVFVDYSRSPEVKFPVAINEAYSATKWVAEHGEEIDVDGKRLAIVGNSAGGNIANAVTLMAKERSGPEIKLQVLFWPVTDSGINTSSYQSFANGYFLSRGMMRWFWASYIPDVKSRKDIHASPLQAKLEELKGLPPTVIHTAELDVLRDEGEAYARKLDKAGVEVISVRYNGMIHDYGLLNALSQVPGTRASLLAASEELKRRLKVQED